ncbi:hypothetical protein CU103_09135 [Phyllobacterium sophorae]|uniref:N-acetyltransferase domain-containing protein n=2 Tax=Phyllobacterium sophorae TaxID=1520277 RepID=A0A2P7BFH3_9HYPH|nr:hypothetical protein CU103_09135 [Phyllobacterium sophorae]
MIADFASWRSSVGADKHQIRVALRDGDIVGWVFVRGSRNQKAELAHLCVEPSSRRIGVGSALLEAALSICEGRASTLVAGTEEYWTSAHQFLEKVGYQLSPKAADGRRVYSKTIIAPSAGHTQ